MIKANSKYTPLPQPTVRELLAGYGVGLSDDQASAIQSYIALLLLWNQKINLTSVTEPRQILERHFGESMFAAQVVPMRRGRLADVGPGAGFPGLALKIACPELDIILIEPNLKKGAFLAEVCRLLQLRGVEIVRNRLENLKVSQGYADFVTARAVGGFPRLLAWSRSVLSSNGRLLLWLGADDAVALSRASGWTWSEPVPIPKSRRRVLLTAQPAVP